MSIFIKGMEMPKNCDDCFLGDFYCEKCQHIDGYKMAGRRPSACPLIEVPTPHGRLIDADDFDSRIRAAGGLADEELTDDFKDGVLSVLTLMKTQNTVIEAEEGEG